jgi:hypothetical protein
MDHTKSHIHFQEAALNVAIYLPRLKDKNKGSIDGAG